MADQPQDQPAEEISTSQTESRTEEGPAPSAPNESAGSDPAASAQTAGSLPSTDPQDADTEEHAKASPGDTPEEEKGASEFPSPIYECTRLPTIDPEALLLKLQSKELPETPTDAPEEFVEPNFSLGEEEVIQQHANALAAVYALFENDQLFLAETKQQWYIIRLAHAARDNELAKKLFEEMAGDIRFVAMQGKLEQSYELLEELSQDETEDPWKVLHQSNHTTTAYQKEDGSDMYTFKVTSVLRGDVVRIIAVLNEVDLFKDWFPFMSDSVHLRQVGRFRKQFTLKLWFPWPLADRDMLLDGWGVDMLEQSQTIINVSSLPETHELSISNPPSKGVVRGSLNGGFRIKLIDRESASVTIMLNIDMQLTNLSTRMVNYFSGKLIHALPGKIETAAKKEIYSTRIADQPFIYQHISEIVQKYWDAEDAELAQKEKDEAAADTEGPAETPEE